MFHLIFLKPDFDWSDNFILPWVNKFTTETQHFMSVIANIASWFVAAVKTIIQFADQVKTKFYNWLAAFQDFSKNYLSLLMVTLFPYHLHLIFCLTCYFFFKIKWILATLKSTITLSPFKQDCYSYFNQYVDIAIMA